MKNIVTILVLVIAFTFTTQAQQRGGQQRGGQVSTEKMLEKMTTDLNLTEDQQNKIKPLLENQKAEKKASMEARKAARESGVRPSKEEREQLNADSKEKATAFNTEMKNILDEEQFAKFEAMANEKKGNTENRGKKKKN
ncbi:Spy/CpxP family protein refolding chaperone [Polaribacter sp. 11A2H]|uniref:Spy/CpxP family protein refolding chaperone n=1 Tax=Polaribacter sp. 11A2H TaxID=2687290 RepID=UPI0014077FDD|nr:Spy/CpxP family protein refolding chaperone [Polaribacter sp. 11A2H]